MLSSIKSRLKRVRAPKKVDHSVTGIDLSVIVPVYNVENYVTHTLESLVGIKDIALEIVVVDDGSPDKSMTIVREFAQADDRIKIVVQENAGLGAARNRGVAESKGRYIAFIDSDDLVEPNALEEFVSHLNLTGSDLAVGHYRHLVNGTLKPAGQWILNAHSRTETATLASRPDILVNAIVCSKVFRRSFWNKSGLAFPVGVLYEDQDVSTLAYARAKSFDIMSTSLIQWRRRETGDSITQQTAQASNLVDRFASANRSLHVLRDNGYPNAVSTRALEYLANNTFTLAHIANNDDEYWEVLRSSLPQLTSLVSEDDYIRRVAAPDRAIYHCISEDLRETAVKITTDGGRNIHAWKTTKIASERFLQWPDEALELSLPRHASVLGSHDHKLVGTLDSFDWTSSDSLRITGSIYISGLDATLERTISAVLVDEESGFGHKVEATATESFLEQRRSGARYRDLSSAGFSLDISLAQVLEKMAERKITQLNLGLLFTVREGEIQRSGEINRRSKVGSAQTLLADFPDPKTFVRPSWSRTVGLKLNIRPTVARAEAVRSEATDFELAFKIGTHTFEPTELLARGRRPMQDPVRIGSVRRIENDIFGAALLEDLTLDRSAPSQFELLVADKDGNTRLLHTSQDDRLVGSQMRGIVLDRTHTSRLLLTERRDVSCNWRITPKASDCFEVAVDVLDLDSSNSFELAMEGPGGSIRVPLKSVNGQTLTFIVNEERAQLGVALKTGLYTLDLLKDGARMMTPLSELPNWSRRSVVSCNGWSVYPRLAGYERLGFEVQPAALRSFASNHALTKLRANYWASTAALSDSFYLQCLKGDQANDNQLQLALALKQEFPNVRVAWGVQDGSVQVPSGQDRVIIGSPEYFETIASAKILCFNHEVPDHFRKREGQIFVQTYHGHPFKLMGMQAWKHRKKTNGEISRGLRAREIWDVLVSPNEFATQLYKENFPLDYDVIETGHPRNDPLAKATSTDVAQIRERLGIPQGSKAVLYAPTYRDQKSSNPWSSPIVDFFNPAQLAEDLGEDYCVLLRGHPANARFDPSEKHAQGLIDVSLYPDINDLILAADIGVFDYSSLRFDFGVTGKPMYFFVPDFEEYFELTPPLFPYEKSIVGEKITEYEELVSAVVSDPSDSFRAELDEYRRTFAPNDDGNAAARVARALVSRMGL